MIKAKAYLNGIFIERSMTENIVSPETQKTVGTMPSLANIDISLAYKYARNAQNSWELISKQERIKILSKWADLIKRDKNKIANIMVQEISKPLNSSLSEIDRTIEYIHATILEYKQIHDNHIEINSNKSVDISLKPLGVILVIAPFNYPINLSMTKLAPALLTGNTVVYKSATNGTLSCSKMVELAHEAGIPKGVLNFVTGRGSVIGDALIHNDTCNAVMFTGGTTTGLTLAKAMTLRYLMFELGGKDAAIVCEDADLEKTSSEIISGAFSYSGQRCTAIKRVFVHKNVKTKLVSLLVDKVNKLTVGSAINNNQITALINTKSADFVESLIYDAIKRGATIMNKQKREGNLIWPLIIDNVTLNMRITHEEQFGPILPIMEFSKLEDAIKWTNDTEYGLQASIFTENIQNGIKISKQIIVGSCNINGASQRSPDFLPFVGVKGSGLTTQGIKYALNSVVREFNIVINK